MSDFLRELKRRNVFRVGIAYVLVSWAILQFVDIIQDPLSLPEWFQKVTIVFIAIGFPVALIVSWAFEVTPEGVMKTADVDKSKSITHGTGTKINKLIIGALVLAVAFLLYDKFFINPDQSQPIISEAQAAQTSIAVLPFVNMSSDPEQEFFSDGITEEILNVLAKNRSLKVAGRTSSFAFKGENQDLRAIGEALGVDFLVEGSIRKAGNTVRITAQVIKADDGFHIWSETYDRELTDIFAVQDEIARSVSDALEVSFGLAEGESLVFNTTNNMAAYDLYLKARDAHKFRRVAEAIELSRQVTQMEPDFAPGWATYAQAEALAPFYIHNFELLGTAGAMGRAKAAANKALTLDPNSIDALGALANVFRVRKQWLKAEDIYLRALELDPNSPVILEDYTQFLIAVGKMEKSLEVAKKLAALEQGAPIYVNNILNALSGLGDYKAALPVAERVYEMEPSFEIFMLSVASLHALLGDPEKGWEIFNAHGEVTEGNRKFFEIYMAILENKAGDLTPEQRTVLADDPYLMALLGQKENLFRWLSREVKLGWWGDFFTFFPDMRKFASTPEFKNHLYELELPSYWRATGWPDNCRPQGAEDFTCE